MPVLDSPREPTVDEMNAFTRLRSKVGVKARRNRLRSSYVEAKKRLDKIGFSVPPHMVDFQTPIGWAQKAVSVPASRIRPDGFTLPRETELMDDVADVFEDNYFAAVEKMAIESSLEHSVAFVFVTPGDEVAGDPEVIISARTALEATAEVNERTNRATAALEVVSRKKSILYLPGQTVRLESINGRWLVTADYDGVEGNVPCTPYVWGRSLKRPFGHSRVSRPLMGYIDTGVRTMLRQEVTAEFFSAPQRALMGADDVHFTDADGNRISPLDALMGGIWALPDVYHEDLDELKRPDLKQLQQASMQPHSEQLRTIGLMVASEVSMPVGYLGIIHDQPTSADAIKAAESDMVGMVEDELPSIAISRIDLAKNVLAVKHGEFTDSMRRDLRGLAAHFRDPGTPTKSAQADAAVKYQQAFPNGDPEVAMEEYGLTKAQIERNLEYAKRAQSGQRLDAIMAAARGGQGTVTDA
ncbi:phage portal protein [Zhihengliuella halotolerans]|uniref:phage portal protein n=1 Tax=Zhihengliuella halotolerans TaxID=370736 RepID=UPI0011AF75E2|nr:phage portal protein [Zhihengliuella halotolerans]